MVRPFILAVWKCCRDGKHSIRISVSFQGSNFSYTTTMEFINCSCKLFHISVQKYRITKAEVRLNRLCVTDRK